MNHTMRSPTPCHHRIATRDVAGMGRAGFDSGVVLGLVVVDANRPAGRMPHPAPAAGSAGGLSRQLIVATATAH